MKDKNEEAAKDHSAGYPKMLGRDISEYAAQRVADSVKNALITNFLNESLNHSSKESKALIDEMNGILEHYRPKMKQYSGRTWRLEKMKD